jgi:hypothetical protein
MPRHRQQVRTFAMIWAGLTLLIGACTFVSIYAATGVAASNNNRGLPAAAITLKTTPTPEDATGQPAETSNTTASTVPPTSVAVQVTATSAPAQKPTQGQAAGAQVVAPPTATIVPIKDTDFDLGIAVKDDPNPKTYQVYVDMVSKQLKLNWAKLQVVWRDTEKTKGQIDWSATDLSIKMMHDANVKVMLSVVKAPDWARDKGAPIGKVGLDGPPADPQDLGNFLTAVLKRYPNMIHAVEVWNEINLDREWSTAPQTLDPKRYVTLLKTARDAIKAADPNIIVISAALSPTGANNDGKYMDDFAYFDKLVAAGMLDNADCVGAHSNGLNVPPTADWNNIPERKPRATYRGPWQTPDHSWSFKSTLEGYEKRIQAAGKDLKLCVTEFGWPSVEGLKGTLPGDRGYAKDNTLADQADFIDAAITEMQKWGFVRLAFLFNLNYGPAIGWSIDPDQGGDNTLWCIIGPDFAVRPVWQKIVDRDFRGQPRKAS